MLKVCLFESRNNKNLIIKYGRYSCLRNLFLDCAFQLLIGWAEKFRSYACVCITKRWLLMNVGYVVSPMWRVSWLCLLCIERTAALLSFFVSRVLTRAGQQFPQLWCFPDSFPSLSHKEGRTELALSSFALFTCNYIPLRHVQGWRITISIRCVLEWHRVVVLGLKRRERVVGSPWSVRNKGGGEGGKLPTLQIW